PEITGFVSVSPPANMYDFSFLAPCPSSGLVINGESDRIAPPPDVDKFVAKLKTQRGITITHQTVPEANHFYERGMDDMVGGVEDYMRMRMNLPPRDSIEPLPAPDADDAA
ncbi:MAG: alpha/beta hydrolase, partial [Pseudomonadota bacterium]